MRLLHRLTLALAAVAALCAAGIAAAQAPVTTQAVRVYITSTAFADIGEAQMRRRVGLLIADVNAVFAQQSRRRFSIDTVNDIHVIPPFSLFPTHDPLTADTAIVLGITDDSRFAGTYSTGPNLFNNGASISMTSVLHLHDPLDLPTEEERSDYLRTQLRGLVHELEHAFGAGYGEYYELTQITDDTGVEPRIDLDYFESFDGPPTDPYWSQHQEYSGDPLMTAQYANPRVGSPMTREAVIAATRFTRGTLSLVNTDWPGIKPTMDPATPLLAARDAVRVKLVDRESGAPIAATGFVRIFQFTQSLFGTASGFPIRGQAYDPAVPWTFPWPGFLARGFNWGENRVLVKATAAGYLPDGVWFSIYDVWDQVVVDGRPVVEITLPMSRVDAPLPTIALVAPTAASGVENGGEFTLTLDLAAAEGLREVTLQTPDGFPVCRPRFYGVGVVADRFTCTASLFGVTGEAASAIVTVKDQARRTTTTSLSFRLVDTVGPNLTLFPAWPPVVLASREPTQALLEYFDASGVDRYQLTLGSQVLCAASVAPTDPGIAFCPWTAPRIPDGTMRDVTLTLTAWDRLGNVATTSGSVTVDALPPTLRIVSPAPGTVLRAGTDVTFQLDVADASGLDSVEIVASGQTLCVASFAPFDTCTFTIPAGFDGGKTFHVTARDAALNSTKVELDLVVHR